MKLKRLFLIILLTLSFSGYTQSSNNSIFWEVTGNGLTQPSYLYGTIHLMDARVFQFDKIVLKKLKKCEVVTGELVFDKVKNINGMFSMMKSLFMPSGTRLKDLYEDPEDYATVKEYIDNNLGILAMMADSIKWPIS